MSATSGGHVRISRYQQRVATGMGINPMLFIGVRPENRKHTPAAVPAPLRVKSCALFGYEPNCVLPVCNGKSTRTFHCSMQQWIQIYPGATTKQIFGFRPECGTTQPLFSHFYASPSCPKFLWSNVLRCGGKNEWEQFRCRLHAALRV